MNAQPTVEEIDAVLLGCLFRLWFTTWRKIPRDQDDLPIRTQFRKCLGMPDLPQQLLAGTFREAFIQLEELFKSRHLNTLWLAFRYGCGAIMAFELLSHREGTKEHENYVNDADLVGLPPETDRRFGTEYFISRVVMQLKLSAMTSKHVFLCHGSEDKAAVRALGKSLRTNGFATWLDEECILPGKHWDTEIRNAIKNAAVVLVLLSRSSVGKRGYLQREIRYALDVLAEVPEGEIFLIPALLEQCDIPPRLADYQAVRLYLDGGFQLLLASLNHQVWRREA